VGGIISFWWATSFRYDGRHHLVLVGGFVRNQHLNAQYISRFGPFHGDRPGRRIGLGKSIAIVWSCGLNILGPAETSTARIQSFYQNFSGGQNS